MIVGAHRPKGIRVNLVSPGYNQTRCSIDEVTSAMAFLATDEVSFINRQGLIIDGGLVAAIPRSKGSVAFRSAGDRSGARVGPV